MNGLIRLLLLLLFTFPAWSAGPDAERTVKPVPFPKGKSSMVISDSIKGYQYIDYQLRAGAGQKLKASLKGSNRANYFNILPPGSADAAMVIGEFSDNRFDGLLPDDGIYTIRVYLMRSAARRNEISGFKLKLALEGKPLLPVPAKVDAVLPGTRYHASTTVKCEPAYTEARECEAYVVRRSFDGTATVELRWDKSGKRRILFVKGEPKAADSAQAMSYARDERGWRVTFGGDESFEIPEPLVNGG